jgi:Tfp pilus assembly protein PilZ
LNYTIFIQEQLGMDNRRKEMRKKVMAFTPVRDSGRGALLGYLANLTLQGAMVVGEKPLEIDSQISLGIDLPGDLPGISSRRMIIPARVARCVADTESSREFGIGFEFVEITPDHAQIVEALLDRYHFRHREWAKKEE